VQSDREEALVDMELAALGECISPEQFLKRMELQQQLDAKIDSAVRRLLQSQSNEVSRGAIANSLRRETE
jgi:hypothetical protein